MGNSKSNNRLVLREMPHKVRELHYAVMSNERDTVRALIAQGVNVNFPWYNPSLPSIKDGSTPLLCAVSLNHTEIIEVLLKSGAYINKCDTHGITPVFKAAFHVRPTLIETLARAGADVNLSDFSGKTPLYICVKNAVVHTSSCKQAVNKLISSGAIVDKSDTKGQAPIHIAAQWKITEIVQQLISAKTEVNIIDNNGRTPLYICVSSLSTKLYHEDLRHQLPIIISLFRAGSDMLNLVEWLLFKGAGLTDELIEDCGLTGDFFDFKLWYTMQISQPQTLKSMCRKVIQRTISCHGNLVQISNKLPLPQSLQVFVCRKMFYRELPLNGT